MLTHSCKCFRQYDQKFDSCAMADTKGKVLMRPEVEQVWQKLHHKVLQLHEVTGLSSVAKKLFDADRKSVKELMEKEDTERGRGLLKKFGIVLIRIEGKVAGKLN